MYDDRSATNGTHAMTCDTPQCHLELLAPGKDELAEDLALAGWTAIGKDDQGNELFTCSHCSRGTHPAAAVMRSMLGGDEIEMQAPHAVRKDDPCHDPNGDVVGHYMSDAQQGDSVKVKVQFPTPQTPPSAVELYDTMLEGTDDDDDSLGRVSVVAPDVVGGSSDVAVDMGGGEPLVESATMVDPSEVEALFGPGEVVLDAEVVSATQPEAPVPHSLEAAPGASGSGGVFENTKRPDTSTDEAKAKMQRAPATPRGPQIDTAAISRADDAFADFDASTTDWDPDE